MKEKEGVLKKRELEKSLWLVEIEMVPRNYHA